MKKLTINIKDQTVKMFNDKKQNWETCNFIESGLNGVTDKEEIIEHITDREDVNEKEIVFED